MRFTPTGQVIQGTDGFSQAFVGDPHVTTIDVSSMTDDLEPAAPIIVQPPAPSANEITVLDAHLRGQA